eukprot:3932586-Rhodomonas_salina.2
MMVRDSVLTVCYGATSEFTAGSTYDDVEVAPYLLPYAFATRCPITPATELPSTKDEDKEILPVPSYPSSLRPCYVMSGTHIAHLPTPFLCRVQY